MIKWYILEKGKIKLCKDMMKIENFLRSKEKIIKQTHIGKVMVSTVFLSLDHSFNLTKKSKPILFETMIFGSKRIALKDYQVRYSSLKDAKNGHLDAVKFAKHILK